MSENHVSLFWQAQISTAPNLKQQIFLINQSLFVLVFEGFLLPAMYNSLEFHQGVKIIIEAILNQKLFVKEFKNY
jgi:hypothetical protein